MQCVVLAGGLGLRMRSYTERMPKALIPIHGKPFLAHQLELLGNSGVTEVIISAGYRANDIRTFIGDGARWPMPVRLVDEGDTLRGTAGALRLAADKGLLAQSFAVVYGDSYLPVDYRPIAAQFKDSRAPALMTVYRNEGRLERSNACYEKGRVTLYQKGLAAEQRPAQMVYVDYGLTFLQASTVLDRVPNTVPSDLATLFHQLSLEGSLAGYEFTSRFYEIGSPEGLRDLEQFLVRGPNPG